MTTQPPAVCPRCGSQRNFQGAFGSFYECESIVYCHPNPYECEDSFTDRCKLRCADQQIATLTSERDRLLAEVDRLKSLIDDTAFEDQTNDKGD